MKTLFLMNLLWLLATRLVWGQTTLTGRIVDKGDHPLDGANVYIDGTATGTSSDSAGAFRFQVDTVGTVTLIVSYLGYKTYRQSINLTDSVPPLTITLLKDPATLDPVTVTAGSFDASDRSKGAALTPIDVVSVSGSNGDVANSLRVLPGTQQVGEQEGLFVRGGSSDESKQFIDGTLFRSPNFSSVPGLIQPPRITPFLFKGIVFSSGGYSAQYGQALSGALILESVDLPEKSSAIIGGAPNLLTVGFQQLTLRKKSSFGINTRYVNSALYNRLVPQRPDYFAGPRYLTIDGNYRVKIGETGMLKLYVNVSDNLTGLRRPDTDSLTLRNSFQVQGRNRYANVSFRQMLGPTWKIDLGVGYNDNQDRIQNRLLSATNDELGLNQSVWAGKNTDVDGRGYFAQGRVVLTRFLRGSHTLRFGTEHSYTRDRYVTRFRQADSATIVRDHLTAGFVETDVLITLNMTARLGVRYEYSALLNRSSLAPRLSVAYRFPNEGQLNFAYGIFYQKPDNRFLAGLGTVGYGRADHYILNYVRRGNNRFFRTEAYYKRYAQLVRTVPTLNDGGSGYARGIELFWRDKRSIKGVDYWVSYTYLDSKRQYLNFPFALQPSFVTPHTASLVAKRTFDKLKIGVSLTYSVATGRPYYFISTQPETGQSTVGQQGKTGPYNSLNVGFSRFFTLFPKAKTKDFTGIAAGINNLLGADPVFGYSYSVHGQIRTPITLPAPRIYFIGIFMNLGIDRTNDLLDSTL